MRKEITEQIEKEINKLKEQIQKLEVKQQRNQREIYADDADGSPRQGPC